MGKEELLEYVNLFREKAEQNKLVIFVGAGVSCNVDGMPSWNDLITEMAKSIGYTKCSTCKHKEDNCSDFCKLKYDFTTDEHLKIPQYVYNHDEHGVELYYDILKKNIDASAIDAPMSSAIFDINPVHIITTNYDHLLENSLNVFREQYEVIIYDKDLLNTDKSKYIIKMHGDISEPEETIVLKEGDYLDYSQKHILIELFVKSMLVDHTILFLGYSLNDYNVKLILNWINYMRIQNDSNNSNHMVGYIVLDEPNIDSNQSAYFKGNNIEVININDMPTIPHIPESLTKEKGKRLYSFLKIISNPSLEDLLSPTDTIKIAVKHLSQHHFVDYNNILKSLNIKRYRVIGSDLSLHFENDYNKIEQFLNNNTPESVQLKQLLINAGITSIKTADNNWGQTRTITIGEYTDNALLNDEIFKLYIGNKYGEIYGKIQNKIEEEYINKKAFYQSIVSCNYKEIGSYYDSINPSSLCLDKKVAYLYNSDFIYKISTRNFDSKIVKSFIENITPSKEKDLYSTYLDLLNGSVNVISSMQKLFKHYKNMSSNKKIIYIDTPYEDFLAIKALAISQYLFYFNNHVFFLGFSNVNELFQPYIEAIIYSSSNQFDMLQNLHGKYQIDKLDFDIMTKFIRTKDLNLLIQFYNVSAFNATDEDIMFFADCFKHLAEYIVKYKTHGFLGSAFSTLANIALILNLTPLNNTYKETISKGFHILFESKYFIGIFFSNVFSDYKENMFAFAQLSEKLSLSTNLTTVEKIFNEENFFKYAPKCRIDVLRKLIMSLIGKLEDEESQVRIKDLIDNCSTVSQKVFALRLLYKGITDISTKNYFSDFLSSNFTELSPQDIYDLVLSGWLDISEANIECMFEDINDMNKNSFPWGIFKPNHLETELICVCILHILGRIPDISELNNMAEGRPYLQFLLNPDNFDYTQVDFSNYIWEYFARQQKYINKFIENKEALIPKIKKRIEYDTATDIERRILYGFLMNKNDILSD